MPDYEWLPLEVAAKQFGYSHKQSFTARLRQLRQQGLVVDLGRPPKNYLVSDKPIAGKIIMMWPNPKAALIRSDAPKELLDSRQGKRPRSK